MTKFDLLVEGEPAPHYAYGVRNVLASPVSKTDIFLHCFIYGQKGITARPFEGLSPRIEAVDEAGKVTADMANAALEWKWRHD